MSDDEELQQEPSDSANVILWIGYIVTAAWVLLTVFYVVVFWQLLCELPANALGDFSAGVAAPLAFLWLVLAVLLQRQELRLQRQELRESRKAQVSHVGETRALVEQNALSVSVASRSLDVQMGRFEEQRIDRLIDALANRILLWAPNLRLVEDLSVEDPSPPSSIQFFGRPNDKQGADGVLLYTLKELSQVQSSRFRPQSPEVLRFELLEIIRLLDTIIKSADKGDFPVLQARIRTLALERYKVVLEKKVAWVDTFLDWPTD